MSTWERFLTYVYAPDGTACWTWAGARTAAGYGEFNVDGRIVLVHRYIYEECVGPIPEGLHIDHLCRNRACVNPLHLEPVTCGENIRRGVMFNSTKTQCPLGHLYSNTSPRGGRICRPCVAAASRRYRKSRKVA